MYNFIKYLKAIQITSLNENFQYWKNLEAAFYVIAEHSLYAKPLIMNRREVDDNVERVNLILHEIVSLRDASALPFRNSVLRVLLTRAQTVGNIFVLKD